MKITLDDLIVDSDLLNEIVDQELRDAALLEGATKKMIELLYSPTATIHDDPAAASMVSGAEPPDDFFEYVAWSKLQQRATQKQHELTDLMHVVERNRPDQRRQALAEWQAHMNDGWETVNISELLDADGKITRIVILRRECPPPTLSPEPLMAAASAAPIWAASDTHLNAPAPSDRPVTVTIHPTVTVIPQERPANPVLAKLLAEHPIAAHLYKHGKDDVLDIMNQKLREDYDAAYQERLAMHQRRPFTPVPRLNP